MRVIMSSLLCNMGGRGGPAALSNFPNQGEAPMELSRGRLGPVVPVSDPAGAALGPLRGLLGTPFEAQIHNAIGSLLTDSHDVRNGQ